MTIFLQDQDSRVKADIHSTAERMLAVPMASVQRLGGGLNSRVYQLTAANGARYALKLYFRELSAARERLDAEYSGLCFLWEHGIRSIPQPLAVDQEQGCAIYEFIDGQKIFADGATGQDIERAAEFLAELKGLKEFGDNFPPASEAYFCAENIYGNLRARINRLAGVDRTGEEHDALQSYLKDDFQPFLETLTGWSKKEFSKAGMVFSKNIGREERTLSPSDFGFHNALRDKTGRVVFLDFEHFGWDDPAKMIADFLLHPAMALGRGLKQQFVTSVLGLFKERKTLASRMKILYPVFGLKWCLIFLNEFIPNDFRRRNFAHTEAVNKQGLLQGQLAKARDMLNEMKRVYREFPYKTDEGLRG